MRTIITALHDILDREIEECKNMIEDAEWTIKEQKQELEKLTKRLKEIEAAKEERQR